MIVFDAEIVKLIPSKREEPFPGIEYCEGWKDFPGMGISCLVTNDYILGTQKIFLEDNLKSLEELINSTDFIVGFNNDKFDNKLLEANGIIVPEEKSFDILAAIVKTTGTFKGLGMNAIAEANFGICKSGHGSEAPINWQKGKKGDVINYCIDDVNITVQILQKILEKGYLIDPRDNESKIHIEIPRGMYKYADNWIKKKFKHKEAFCLMNYECRECSHYEAIWNSRDGVTPFAIRCSSCSNGLMNHVNWDKDIQINLLNLEKGQRYFADMTFSEYKNIKIRTIKHFATEDIDDNEAEDRFYSMGLDEDFEEKPTNIKDRFMKKGIFKMYKIEKGEIPFLGAIFICLLLILFI